MTDELHRPDHLSRRELLKGAAVLGASAALGGIGAREASAEVAAADGTRAFASMIGVPFEKRDTVRVAIVGTGLRGRSVIHELTGVPGVRITALADPVPEKVEMAVQQMKKAGHDYEPARFTDGDHAFEELVRRDDIDLVYTATPWQWHVPVVLAAMNAGKHAATEVPAAYTIDDCWKIV
ncbi:MAG: Gfo/Idh/MocA family oxidoreductase, partial [Gemmatimonadaceae bacterium]